MRKGQTALEYLLIIVVALVIIVLLMMFMQGSSNTTTNETTQTINCIMCQTSLGYRSQHCTECNETCGYACASGVAANCSDGIQNGGEAGIDCGGACPACAIACVDGDGDGYNATAGGCGPIDCNDSNPSIHPGAIEVCNGIDDDCDLLVDEGVLATFYGDKDGDTYGNLTNTTQACTPPAGYVVGSTDCNDSNSSIHPGATEVCGNGIDEDCSGADASCGGSCTPNCECTSCQTCTEKLADTSCQRVCLTQDINNVDTLLSAYQTCVLVNRRTGPVTFDCKGNLIDGVSIPPTVGFYIIRGSKITMTDCEFSNWGVGIFTGGSQATVENCNSHDNADSGIQIADAGGSGHIVRNSRFSNNGDSQIELASYTNNALVENNVVENTVSNGIRLDANSHSNRLVNNVISGSTTDGISIDNSNSNQITGNSVTSSRYGVFVWGTSANNVITSNIVKDCKAHGIALAAGSLTSSTISNNTVCFNNKLGGYFDMLGDASSSGSSNTCDTGSSWHDTDSPGTQPCRYTC